jgi:hypothetical protein
MCVEIWVSRDRGEVEEGGVSGVWEVARGMVKSSHTFTFHRLGSSCDRRPR